MRWTAFALVVCVGFTACGGSKPPTSPTSTTPGTTPSGGAPVVAIAVKADAAGSRDAVTSLSEVLVDASGSSGTGLAYAIDFGDGATATTASAKHVYTAPSTYTIAATVTDSQGRKATGTAPIAVRDATGNWFQAGFAERSKRIEVRQISIDAQTGSSVHGSYRVTGEVDKFFSGTLTAPRSIRLTTDGGGVTLEGTLPGRLNDEAELWTLLDHGDGADGQRLDFHAVVGTPDGPPPSAAITLRVLADRAYDFAYGQTPGPIPGITPVQIDGTASRGTDLSYFLEFGDGSVATESQAARTLDVPDSQTPFLTARVTVVDRFGRSATASRDYYEFQMPTGGGGESWFSGYLPDGLLAMGFPSRSGTSYTVALVRNAAPRPGYSGSGSAQLSGAGDVRITIPALGIGYEGKLTLGPTFNDTQLTLVQRGGPDDGRTWTLLMKPYS